MSRQLVFVFHFSIVLQAILASLVCLEDISDNSNRSFVLGDTACQERNHSVTIFLGICWLLLHVILLLDAILFQCVMTNHVRLAARRKMS